MDVRRLVGTTAALALLASGCAPAPSGIVVSGTVDDTLKTVTVPSLTVPAVNLDAGFTDLTGAYNPATGTTAPKTSSVGTTYDIGATVRIASVKVAQGDTVKAGQVVATVDTHALDAALASAKADAEASAANVGLISDAIDTTYDKEADVKDARQKVHDAIDKIHDGQAKLLKARKTIQQALPKLKAALAQVEQMIATYPPVPPPNYPTLEDLQASAKKLTAQIAQLTAGLKKINATLPQLAAGLKKAKAGLKKLDDAEAKITDARGTLRDQKKLLEILADTAPIQVDVVHAQVSLATLRSPVDGVVVSVAAAGDQLAPDATVVSIRETGPSTVTGWLSPAQLDQVCQGDSASVAGDWTTTTTPAALTRIGTAAQYPPSTIATDEIHLTRAIEVQFTATRQLPAGVPVEVTIQGCRPAADTNETNR